MVTRPLVDGDSAWVDYLAPPAFEPEARSDLDWSVRRWPAAIRILGRKEIHRIERMSESDIYAATSFLNSATRRRNAFTEPITDEWPESAIKLATWMRALPRGRKLRTWWISQWGWRSPTEFPGWQHSEKQLHLPHLEPYEVAKFRIPDDIAMDLDVVMFVAWCQGVSFRMYRSDELQIIHKRAVRRGLLKYHMSPWI